MQHVENSWPSLPAVCQLSLGLRPREAVKSHECTHQRGARHSAFLAGANLVEERAAQGTGIKSLLQQR